MDGELELFTRLLPDGRYEITLGWCIPVIMSAETFHTKTDLDLWILMAEFTMNTYDLAKKRGLDLPLETGVFIEDEWKPGCYTLEGQF